MENNRKKIFSILKLCLLGIIIVAIPLYFLITRAHDIQGLKDLENFENIVDSITKEYFFESVLIYLTLQVLQIIVSVLPGQVFQMAAGYIFGIPLGLFFSIIGAFLGSTIAYFLAVTLGHNSLKYLVKTETLNYWVERLNSKKAYIIVFILYLIPGLPKDVVAYAAGMARMNYKAFIVLSLLGRIPAMTASILMGAFYDSNNYIGLGIVAAVTIVIFVICIIKRKSINAFIDNMYERVSNQ